MRDKKPVVVLVESILKFKDIRWYRETAQRNGRWTNRGRALVELKPHHLQIGCARPPLTLRWIVSNRKDEGHQGKACCVTHLLEGREHVVSGNRK